ncbi:hypothetical protein NL676_008793 [Syzygium grande]|nr:hypothetical protein NL676_008793 [Syzygium grande]
MSVNDIVTSGAKPLFFLDYFATSHLDVDLAEKVIKGIVDGCQQADCVLLGGETAEMPNFYAEGEYDLSGFAVGIVKKDSVIDGKDIVAGDVLIGLPSSGVHSNGFSLVRRVLARSGLSLTDQLPGEAVTVGEALMAPTVIYVNQVLNLINKGGLGATIYGDSWVVPPLFKWIQEVGNIEDSEMRRTFNMGIGMVLVVSPEAALRILGDNEITAYRIGDVVNGNEGIKMDLGIYARDVWQVKQHRPRVVHPPVDSRGLLEEELTLSLPDLAAWRCLADCLEELGQKAEQQLERPRLSSPRAALCARGSTRCKKH